MANGDKAAAVGMDVVAGTDDRRQGYDEINKSRDYLADHITDGAHRANQITSGTLVTARGGTGRSNIYSVPTSSAADPDSLRLVVADSNGSLYGLTGVVGSEYLGYRVHFTTLTSVDFDDGQAVEAHGAPFTPTVVIAQGLLTASGGLVVCTARADNEPANDTNVFLRAWGVAGPYDGTLSKVALLCLRSA